MKLSCKLHLKLNAMQLAIINELSYHTTKLYNIARISCIRIRISSYLKCWRKTGNHFSRLPKTTRRILINTREFLHPQDTGTMTAEKIRSSSQILP